MPNGRSRPTGVLPHCDWLAWVSNYKIGLEVASLLSKQVGSGKVVQPVRILIADDHARSREGLRALLATSPAVEVVGEAANGQEAVELAEVCCPDVVLMDLDMPVMSGLEAAGRIKNHWPEIKVCMLTMSKASLSGKDCIGVDEVLIKGCPVEKLWAAIVRSE